MDHAYVRMHGIHKRFGGIKALNDVHLEVYPGEVLGLMGENGAGKSTLMRILCGLKQLDEGTLTIGGEEHVLRTPQDAQQLGIGMIPQELLLVDALSVSENIFLGKEATNGFHLLDEKSMRARTRELLESIGCRDLHPDTELSRVSKADQQMIAIARRVVQGGQVFVMDEPTSALTEQETQNLFTVIRKLCDEGRSVIFISHRLEEVLEICDRFVVLRDGENAAEFPNGPAIDREQLITPMIGSVLGEEYPHQDTTPGECLFEAQQVSFTTAQGQTVDDISFSIHQGEVVGIAGLVGVGKSELAQTMVGIRKIHGGQFFFNGKAEVIGTPVKAAELGIGYVTEDRRGEGLVLGLKSLYNMTLRSLHKVAKGMLIRSRAEAALGLSYAEKLHMKPQYLGLDAQNLSGGNQQKVVVIRQLISDSQLIIFDEPTKGIDVGAKAEIAKLIGDLSRDGKGICIFSSEPREVLGVSDRIYVLNHEGLAGPFLRGTIDYTRLMSIEFGGVE